MLVWLFSLLLSCSEPTAADAVKTESPDLRPKVRVTTIAKQEFSRTLQIPATIQAIRSAVLVPKVPGRISDISVRIGDSVKQGDLLLALEKSDYLAGFQEAKASKELAQLQAEQAAIHFSRFEALRKEGAITSVQLEEASVNSKLAESQALRASAGFDVAKNRLQDTELRAPFSGIIIARNVEIGEIMGGPAQRPPLMLADLQRVRFIADVGETDIGSIQQDQSASLILFGDTVLEVTIERINNAVDPVINTIQIEGTLDNTERNLRHGQSATLSVELKERTQVSLARSALLSRNAGKAEVFVLRKDNTIEKRIVSYGRSDSGNVPILSGLSQGEKVLISGHTRLNDGDDVVVVTQE